MSIKWLLLIVMIGMTPDPEDLSNISEYSEVGATWWIEASAPWSRTLDEMKEQIRRDLAVFHQFAGGFLEMADPYHPAVNIA